MLESILASLYRPAAMAALVDQESCDLVSSERITGWLDLADWAGVHAASLGLPRGAHETRGLPSLYAVATHLVVRAMSKPGPWHEDHESGSSARVPCQSVVFEWIAILSALWLEWPHSAAWASPAPSSDLAS